MSEPGRADGRASTLLDMGHAQLLAEELRSKGFTRAMGGEGVLTRTNLVEIASKSVA